MLCHYYPPHTGGVELIVWNVARSLAPRHDVTVVTSAIGSEVGTSVEDGVTIVRTDAYNLTERFGIPYPIPAGGGLAKAIQHLAGVDVLHAHGALYPGSIHASRLAQQHGIPLAVTEHVGFVVYRNPLVNAVESVAWSAIGDRVMTSASAITTYNSRVQQWLGKRYASRDIEFIGNGVDTTRFRSRSPAERSALRQSFGLPDDRPLVLFAARDSQKKNLGDVLAIARDAFHLVVCGATRGLRAENLTDLGIVPYDRMSDLFGCVDTMVHASTGEGFPLAVQEALASGLPVAILWDPGYAESLDRSIVAACDSLDQLGPTIQALATNALLRRQLAQAGRDWTERTWSWAATVAAYEALYDRLTHAKQRRALAS
jgi:D-inositol-3-phosphate glycosyltransferase